MLGMVLAGCATTRGAAGGATCVTPCGMRSAEGNCEELQRFETRALNRLTAAVPAFEPGACRALKGWEVVVHKPVPDDELCKTGWLISTFCAIGYTELAEKRIYVFDTDWQSNALAHEMAHVLDAHATGGRAGHCRWADRRLVRALTELSGLPELSKPEASCTADGGR